MNLMQSLMVIVALTFCHFLYGDFLTNEQIGATQAQLEYGLNGKGVSIIIIDRGIDWRHPDFKNPDGTTRIKWMLDQSGQSLCDVNNPDPIEYSEADINNALFNGAQLPFRDAIGHGTSTAGLAAGNGNAFADGRYSAPASHSDLIIVKQTSEGAPSINGLPAEPFFNACYDQALDWANEKAMSLNQPAVGIINSGVQWGAMDGTSALSRKVMEFFPLDRPGWVMVEGTGDEGGTASHASIEFDNTGDAIVNIQLDSTATVDFGIWYSGNRPAEISVEMDDGATLGPVQPGGNLTVNNITIINYEAGGVFYPWTSDTDDRTVFVRITNHATSGKIRIKGISPGTGNAHLYIANSPTSSFSDHLVAGTLTDIASTPSVVVVANHVLRTHWIDIQGIQRSVTNQGAIGDRWIGSAEGPTRDGRLAVDISSPGENVFAPLGRDSVWSTALFNQVLDGGGWYTRASAVSASAPIAVGAVAMLLQVDPRLTAGEIKTLLKASAVQDTFTGEVPNTSWGSGKLDIHAAVQMTLAQLDKMPFSKRIPFTNPASNITQQSFLRFTNKNTVLTNVLITALDDMGSTAPSGVLSFQLEPGASLHLNAQDLESGNTGKGTSGSLGNGVGKWQLRVTASANVEIMSLVRTPDGFLTSLTDAVPMSAIGINEVYFANPASNQTQQSFLRVSNTTSSTGLVTLSGIDDAGNPAPGGNITFTLGPMESKHFNSLDYENGNITKGLNGALGDGQGKWHLSLNSILALEVMSMIRTPDGFLTNLSEVVPIDGAGKHRIYFANPASNFAQQSFVRIVNTGNSAGTVTISGIDDAGIDAPGGNIEFQLAAFESKQLNSGDIENGNIVKGISGALGDGSGRWRLAVDSTLTIEVMNMIRTSDGFVTNLSSITPKSAQNRNEILVMNPASNVNQSSFIRFVNTSEQLGSVTIGGVDDAGNPAPSGDVSFSIAGLSAVEYSALDLEQGNQATGLSGALGNGAGKWRLTVSSDVDLQVVSLLQTPTGFLTNLSGITPAMPNRAFED